jgi:hypothetical protein
MITPGTDNATEATVATAFVTGATTFDTGAAKSVGSGGTFETGAMVETGATTETGATVETDATLFVIAGGVVFESEATAVVSGATESVAAGVTSAAGPTVWVSVAAGTVVDAAGFGGGLPSERSFWTTS